MKYDEVIVKLENIIENWHDEEELIKYIDCPKDGLCDNIKISNTLLLQDAIKSWMYFEDGHSFFPVGGREEYEKGVETPYSLFNNPKRLHLAVHMLQWFRQYNI